MCQNDELSGTRLHAWYENTILNVQTLQQVLGKLDYSLLFDFLSLHDNLAVPVPVLLGEVDAPFMSKDVLLWDADPCRKVDD